MFPPFPLSSGEVPDPPQVLLDTFNVDLNAITRVASSVATAKANGYHIDGAGIGGLQAADTIIITMWTGGSYVAYTFTGAATNYADKFGVCHGVDDSLVVYATSATNKATAALARAAAQAKEPFYLTGSTEYWLYISDSYAPDNTGGVSLTVQVWGNRP